MSAIDPLLLAVQEILFHDWDPIGVNRHEQARNEYDSYAPAICRMLKENADEYKLASYLRQVQSHSMELPFIDEELNHKVARQLLKLIK